MRVRAGEIVGLYGLIGAGRSEFVQSVFGRYPRTAGRSSGRASRSTSGDEKDAIALGIALVPESRRDQGLCLNLGVGLNLNLPIYKRLTRGIVINPLRRGEPPPTGRSATSGSRRRRARRSRSSLSGGNQQKIVIGKWLNHGAELFIFDEPTVGVDVGTKVEIYQLFAELLKDGAGIILISSYLPEVYELSDTLHVFRRGRLVAPRQRPRQRESGPRDHPDASDRRLEPAAENEPSTVEENKHMSVDKTSRRGVRRGTARRDTQAGTHRHACSA